MAESVPHFLYLKYDFLVNTGMYMLNPDILQFISKDKSFNMIELIKSLKILSRKLSIKIMEL